jgi:hypothetical protein
VRTYARYTTPAGVKGWQEVDTAADGSNDMVFVVTLIQVLLLNLGESPFYANYGIPARPSVQQRVWPDFYVARTQRQFSSYFASLIISAQRLAAEPTYNVDLVTNQGVRINVGVPITQLSQRAPGTPGAV